MTDQFGRPISPRPTAAKPPPPTAPPVVSPPPVTPPSAFLPAAPLPITRDTPFRATGDVSLSVWQDAFKRAGSPIAGVDVERMWMAAQPVSALVLDRLRIESTYGKFPVARNNILGLRDRTGKTLAFEEFTSPVDCVKEVVRRWSDLQYKGGAYAPKNLSLAGMLNKYSPSNENPTEQLIRAAVSNINQWRGASSLPTSPPAPSPVPPPPPSTSITFGKVPRPNIVDRIIPGDKPGPNTWVPVGFNSAFDYLGPRLFRGFCIHIMEGVLDGTDRYFRNEARMSALTDFGLGSDQYEGVHGTIYQWNTKASGRAPYANGSNGEGGEEGDGLAFIARYGPNAINRDLRSIENSGFVDNRTGRGRGWVPDKQLIDCVNLMAYISDQEKVSWKDWPMKDGLTLVYGHFEFSPKSCPGDYIRGRIGSMIDQVGERLKKYQTG